MAAKVVHLDDACDVCGQTGGTGVIWRSLKHPGRAVVLCFACVLEGTTALASFGNRVARASEES